MSKLATYLSFVRFSHSVFALPFALTGALLAWREQPFSWAQVGVDCRLHGQRAQRGDGVQPPGGRAIRRAQPAHGDARAAARRDDAARSGAVRRRRRRSCSSSAPRGSARCASRWRRWRWRSCSGTRWPSAFTTYTQLFLGLALAVAPVGGWIAAGGRGGAEPWLLGLAIGLWVGGFDILYACQDVEFDRGHGLRSIPARFGVADRDPPLARDARRRPSSPWPRSGRARDLPALYLAGVAIVAVLLAYEQSLVSDDDLSQVKKAFDLNGYVGIVYFAATALALYVG